MCSLEKKIKSLLSDFIEVAKLAETKIPEKSINYEILKKQCHPPNKLPKNEMAVYIFFWGDSCLKVGKAGPNSQARYTSQHYNPGRANSNLARSILKNKSDLNLAHLNRENVGDWIKNETVRVNFRLNAELGNRTLSLMETFIQCRLKPRFG
ncbi:hypothetical protein [Sedimentisphaera salicampi]|uniref:GIY-YIG domain-containing protein n=1 Tax=Sedimentisphaera salicampi TaxID=1941349 RepID=A0A1W6LNA7_9BACT|nr:hypothetical protein [Sedimentisphaera salicampi]ARN57259.1 hypothetical protein STSP1_01658 [Sedimentisphaera salicampi]